MRRRWWAGLVLLAAVIPATARDDTKKDDVKKDAAKQEKAASVADQVKAVESDYRQKTNAWFTKYRELTQKMRDAKEDDERKKLRDEQTALMKERTTLEKEHGEKLLDIAKKSPKDPATLTALNAAMRSGGEVGKDVVKLLIENHAKTPGVGALAQTLLYAAGDEGVKFVRDIAENHPKNEDRAQAWVAIATKAKRSATSDRTKKEARDKALAEATDAANTLKDKYADVKVGDKKAGQMAEGILAGIKNIEQLVVGKEVPDIVGPDIDGKEFKLSDYRGKVVLLDFWAHW